MTDSPEAPTSAIDALVNALRMMEDAQRHLRNRIAGDIGMNTTDFTVIGIIDDFRRVTPKLLAAEISMTTGAVTAVIDRLVSSGYVARVPNPRDRRSVFLELTPEGEVTVGRVKDSYRAAAAAALHASPGLGGATSREDLALAAVAITAHTMDSIAACPSAIAA